MSLVPDRGSVVESALSIFLLVLVVSTVRAHGGFPALQPATGLARVVLCTLF